MNSSHKTIDFIGAGAQRAGTSWLYNRLKELPDFSLPPVKELHYFDRSREYPSPNKLAETFLFRRLLNAGWTKEAIRSVLIEIKRGDYETGKWYAKWYFSNFNDNWYLSLFDLLKGIKGEITPGYSILDESDIERMYNIAPKSKIIFLLRNPVERAWSHFRFSKFESKRSNLTSPKLDNREIIYFLNTNGQEWRSNYLRTLNRYTKFYLENQILIGFFDGIKDYPERLLSDIVRFIGGNASHISRHCNLQTKHNVSKKIDMPGKIEEYLKEKYYDMIKELSDTYGSYFTKWYHELYGDHKKGKERLKLTLPLG